MAMSWVQVKGSIPVNLKGMINLIGDLRWTWDKDIQEIFGRVDEDLWVRVGKDPLKLLQGVSLGRLEDLGEDLDFCEVLRKKEEEVLKEGARNWFKREYGGEGFRVVYFSAEYGIHESLPLYSGGLGVLSGDYMKSSDDLGLPVVGVSLAYRQGYFHQRLDDEGWQEDHYVENDFESMPMELEKDGSGGEVLVGVDFPGRVVYAKVWRLKIGRNRLYLLDTDVGRNDGKDREITLRLYGGDHRLRLEQEMILGVGGVRLLRKLGVIGDIYHMNEGHSALMGVERIKDCMEELGIGLKEAVDIVRGSHVFTTHTPMESGLDRFCIEDMDEYLKVYYERYGMDRGELLRFGLDGRGLFSMADLAISLSSKVNGVSRLHQRVSRRMWQKRWGGLLLKDIPIDYVTNGIHIGSWLSGELAELYEEYLGISWKEGMREGEVGEGFREGIDGISDMRLWGVKMGLKKKLGGFIERRGYLGGWDTDILTICFARRFTSYKRAVLLFQDLERLGRILNGGGRGVRLIFSGKAHPRDEEGKRYIQKIVRVSKMEDFRGRVIFLEDYDMEVGRYMVQGGDVWLNTPMRNHEASGTSGMKAGVNGGLNLSILDGWWVEGYGKNNGWVIGAGESYEDREYGYKVESVDLYKTLEEEVIPLYYDRDGEGLPRVWIQMMKESIKSIMPIFNTDRMLKEYIEKLYYPLEELKRRKLERRKLKRENKKEL